MERRKKCHAKKQIWCLFRGRANRLTEWETIERRTTLQPKRLPSSEDLHRRDKRIRICNTVRNQQH
ncbi:MAG: hypothetical protein GY694_14095 [Gammaproteobacteria bacterium]|nr:hypothetical protein [Gammaproteobacteria bacterium]